MTESRQPSQAKRGASPKVRGTRLARRQAHKVSRHLRGIEEAKCNKCGTGLRCGGGHGSGLGFSFQYCDTCHEFVRWRSFGATTDQIREIQDFLKSTFSEEREGKRR